jgi:hypothetical protein
MIDVTNRGHRSYCANRVAYEELLHVQGRKDDGHLRFRRNLDYPDYIELDNHEEVIDCLADIQGIGNGVM